MQFIAVTMAFMEQTVFLFLKVTIMDSLAKMPPAAARVSTFVWISYELVLMTYN